MLIPGFSSHPPGVSQKEASFLATEMSRCEEPPLGARDLRRDVFVESLEGKYKANPGDRRSFAELEILVVSPPSSLSLPRGGSLYFLLRLANCQSVICSCSSCFPCRSISASRRTAVLETRRRERRP